MSLTSALRTASSALALGAAQTNLVAKNISRAGDTGYSRKIGEVSTQFGGIPSLKIDRAADPALRATALAATSTSASSQAVADGLERLQATVGDTTDSISPAAKLGALSSALQVFAASPSDATAGASAVNAAKALAQSLNAASAAVTDVRSSTDQAMSASVDRINSLLKDFDKANDAVVAGLKMGADVTDASDARDAAVSALSNELGIAAIVRPDGRVALYTDSGVTLDNGGARPVTMVATSPLVAGQSGAAVTIDGVAVTGPGAPMPLRTGALAGLAQLRDTVAPQYQSQLDAMAAGLVSAFAETDQSATPTQPDRPGLFTWSGAPSMPASGATGLANSIAVATSVDPSQGGDVSRLRDGNISGGGAAYVYNSSGGAAFADRLNALGDAINATRTFAPGTGLDTQTSIATFATQSVGWLEGSRKSASDAATANAALASQATTALSNATGVSIDDQMSHMLSLENAYQASAKLLTAASSMFDALFAAMPAI